jgi:hypothetical protein
MIHTISGRPMRPRSTQALWAGFCVLLMSIGLVASSSLPAMAATQSSTNKSGVCTTKNASQVASNTRVNCNGKGLVAVGGGGENIDPSCKEVDNGLKTCSVRKLGNGLEFYAMATVIAGFFVAMILWVVGSKGQNPGQELTGKRGITVCLLAAFLIGAYPHLASFYNNIAVKADNTGVTKATANTMVVPSQTPGASTVNVSPGVGIS